MSVRVTSLVWDSDVQAPERFTLLALADRADEEGKCWPSVKWLARKCQTSDRTIRRHLSWLESERLLKRSTRRNDSNVYFVQLGVLRSRKLEDPCQIDTPGQSDTPDNLTPPDTVSPLSIWPPLTPVAVDPCQIDTQYISDSSEGPSTSGTAALAPDPTPQVENDRPDVEALCSHLRDRVIANGAKATITKKWRTEARLLLDRDGRDIDQAHQLISWCTSDNFWQANILSMPKFRQKYDQLRLQAKARGAHLRSVPTTPDDPDAAFADLRTRAAALEASRLIRAPWIEPSQPPSDPTPRQQWLRDRAVEWIDAHEQELRAALTERKTG